MTQAERRLEDCDRVLEFITRQALAEEVPEGERDLARGHAETCAACRALLAATRLLPELERPSAAEVGRATDQTLAAVAGRSARRRRARWLSFGAVGLAASVAAIILGAQHLARPDPLQVVAGAVLGEGGATGAKALATGTSFRAGTDGAVLASAQGTRFYVAADTRARVVELERAVTLEVVRGLVAASVEPATVPVVVLAGSFRVTVKGTVFAVQREGDDARVEVQRGLVEVDELGAARQPPWQVPARSAFSGKDRRVLPSDARRQAVVTGLLAGALRPSDDLLREPAPASAPIEGSPPVRSERAADAPGLEELLSRADRGRAEQDWDRAADAYRALLARFPELPEAATAALALADIELEHHRRPRAALLLYGQYLEARPNGSLAPDALLGQAACLRELGEVERERETLTRLLRQYPLSTHSTRARARLEALQSSQSLQR